MSGSDEQQLREMNEALLLSSVRLHELTEKAEQAQEALRLSNEEIGRAREQAEATLRTSPVPLLVLESDLRVVTANDAFYKRFRVAPEQTLGRMVYDLGNGQWNIPLLRELLEEILPRRTHFKDFQVTHTFQKLGDRTMVLNARRMEVEKGGPERIVLVMEDITERKQAEQALRDSEERFRMLADNMAQLAWTCDRLGNVTWYNQRWLDYTGLTFDDMKGWGWSKVQHPDHLDRVVERVRRSAETGETWEDTFPLRGKDGAYRWFLSRAVPIRDAAGHIVRWFGTNADITEQRETQQALDMARDAAEAANRSKDKFLAVLSHELRTPLTPVVLTIAAMEHDPDLPLKLRDDVAMVRRNIELETKLIDDLLDLSRVTSGKLRLQMQPTSAHAVLRHVLESSARDTSGKRLNVSLELNAAHDRVSADPARLQQVFWNVLRNAIKFTPEGGRISVRSENDRPGALRLVVRDTGAGIPPDVLSKVFDAFEQGDVKTTRQFGGLGLGLAICKAVVEMHGGTIRAASEGAGKGAAFTIELPTVDVREARMEPPEAAGESGAAGPSRVLLVEDHPDTVRALSRLLARSGYQVKTASSIASALQLAAAEPFDIVVSDIGLPDGTGYELMEQMRARYGIQGIALSGYGMEEDVKRSIEAGFADHVVKPVNLAHLENVLRRVARAGGRLPPAAVEE